MIQQEMSYPDAPGYQPVATSKAAAKAVKPKDKPIRELVLESLRKHGPATADEMAERLGLDARNVQPRISQLRTLKKIKAGNITRPSKLGSPAIVWEVL